MELKVMEGCDLVAFAISLILNGIESCSDFFRNQPIGSLLLILNGIESRNVAWVK